MAELPSTAAWRHVDVHEGFEVVFLRPEADGLNLTGHSTGIEDGQVWAVTYEMAVDSGWVTRGAHVVAYSPSGARELRLEGDGRGTWSIDGTPAPHIDGCLDVDLEVSAFTNALPLHRLGLEVGQRSDASAAYVRADLSVEHLEQSYARLEDERGRLRYEYASPRFAYADVLTYDEFGLILDYPGIAARVT
jgi:uncharacterized protein